MEQLFLWEETSNTELWRKPTEYVDLHLAAAKPDSVTIRTTQNPGSISNMIQGTGVVFWPKHPWNGNQDVPYFGQSTGKTWRARFSASRSMFIYSPSGELYSPKMPTSDPHNRKHLNDDQPSKADLRKSVIISNRRSLMIEQIQKAQIKKNPKFDVLLDVLTIADNKTGNGIVIRDLRKLQDGFYYLPALSVPFAGKMIARHLGEDYEKLWGTFWAALLGESKARLLLEYGLQMVTPNAQNMLIQLDHNLRPTGKMLFRDISDSSLVAPVAEGLGLSDHVELDMNTGFRTSKSIDPYWLMSIGQMSEDGVSDAMSNKWGQQHESAYIGTLVSELRRTPTGKKLFAKAQISVQELQDILFSEEGKLALREYRLMTTHSTADKNSVYDP